MSRVKLPRLFCICSDLGCCRTTTIFSCMTMRNYLGKILSVLGILASMSSCIMQEDIDKLQSKIDEIKSAQIATIDKQIEGINTSLVSLQETDKEIKGYISTLQNTADGLQKSINSTNEKIEQAETDLKKDLSETENNLSNTIITAKTELLASLTALRTDMETQLAVINTNITNLQEKDAALEKKIDDLKTYVDSEIKNTEDWASATFATLEQYNALVIEIAGIKANITSINTAISELETRVNGKIASDIETAVSTLEGELQQQAADITQAYKQAISSAKREIEAAYTNAIAQAIASSESTMQTWVNDRLTGYYTIAETDAMLSTLKQIFETKLAGQKEYLEGVISALETALTAKIENNGTLISNLQTQVNGLSADLTTLAETVATNSQNIANNANAILANSQAIAKNTSDIGACEQLIDANKQLIDANTTSIYENANAIADLKSQAHTDEDDIAKNAADIAQNASDIASNAAQIASNATAITNNAIAISNNAANIAQLQSDLSSSITNITSAYTSAISSAITENNGTLNAKIAADIATATAAFQQQIDAINTRINSIDSRVTELETNVEDLINRIQGIEVIPSYSDGSVACKIGDNEFYFEVLPSGSASKLAAVGKDIFKLKAVYTQTKATPTFVNLPISSVRAEGDILVVTVSTSGLTITAEQAANAILTVTSGVSSISTGYFPLYFAASSLVVDATLSSSTPFSASFTCNVSKTDGITEYGICYSEETPLCNNIINGNNIDASGTYTLSLTTISPETTYYYKSYVIKDGLAIYSYLSSFTSPSAEGMIETVSASSITALSAIVKGSVDTSLRDNSTIQFGFCYSNTNHNPNLEDVVKYVTETDDNGEFSLKVVGLIPETQYWYRSFLVAGNKTYLGESFSFSTQSSGEIAITLDYTDLTSTSVTLRGKLNLDNSNYSSKVCGFYLDGESKLASSIGEDGVFLLPITSGLQDNHQGYKYKAFVRLDGNTYCGEELSFDTPEIIIATSGAVDLGLSVKWSACNLGADSPEIIGSLYAWGETTTKSSYTWSNYKWCMGTEKTLIKYNTDSDYGIVDNILTLEPEDDAAYVNLGGKWRMPTSEEFEELINNCDWIWTTYKGQNGCKIVSRKPGFTDRVIFLPHYGIWSDYYSSTTGYAYSYVDVLEFRYDNEYEVGTHARVSVTRRNDGLPIRPVSD